MVDVNTQGRCLLNPVQLTDDDIVHRQVECVYPDKTCLCNPETEPSNYNAIDYSMTTIKALLVYTMYSTAPKNAQE